MDVVDAVLLSLWGLAVVAGLGFCFWTLTERLPWPPFRKRPIT